MTERPRFQFGLRKLLLWTAAMALYLSLGRSVVWTLDWEQRVFIVVACWLIAASVLRAATGPMAAILPSMMMGVLFLSPAVLPSPGVPVAGGVLLGLLVFAIVEGAFAAVHWADNLGKPS